VDSASPSARSERGSKARPRVELGDLEALAGFDADAFHNRDDRLVGDVRWLEFQYLGGVRKDGGDMLAAG